MHLLLLYFLSLYQSDLLNDEPHRLESDSGSSSTYSFCAFSLYFYESAVGVLGYGGCAPIGVESKGGIFGFEIFVPIGVESKGG